MVPNSTRDAGVGTSIGASSPATPTGPAPSARSIVVNGRRHVVQGGEAGYDQLVRLAFPDAGPRSYHTVAYGRGPASAPEALLAPGHRVPLVDDQVFHVLLADQS